MDSGRLETVPSGTVNLDTVRALHQTVVSLRTALEVSKNELKELKEKYQKHSDCISYADVIEKLTIENHILRRRFIDTNYDQTPAQNIQLQVTYSPKRDDLSSDVFIQTATTNTKSPIVSTRTTNENDKEEQQLAEDENRSIGEEIEIGDQVISSRSDTSETIEKGHEFCGTADSFREVDKEQSSEDYTSPENCPSNGQEDARAENISIALSPKTDQEEIQEIEVPEFDQLHDYGSFKAKLELLSKFDVKIRVRTLKEDSVLSSTTSDSESVYGDNKETEFKKRSKHKNFEQDNDNIFQKDFEEKPFKNTDFKQDAKDTKTHIHFIGKGGNFEDKKKKIFHNNFKDKAEANFNGRREHFETIDDLKGNQVNVKAVSSENIKMAVSNEGDTKAKVDNFDIQVKITSEENLVVKETTETCRRKDALNLDVDNLSFRSMSEGDNSVFSEQAMTPQEQAAAMPLGQENSDESEVDDIELIFTTDESKDMTQLQEDLVSIRDSEPWSPQPSVSAHSTPVLVKFHTLDPDFTTEEDTDYDNQENACKPLADSLKTKRVSLPSDKDIIRHVAFTRSGLDLPGRGILKSCDNKSDNMLYRKSPNTSSKRLNSVDSLTGEYCRGLSFDNTKSSSFELGSSMDMIRDESEDSFHRLTHLGHRFSVFAETDISKCGISEEDISANMYLRRNTCPNPFQYRAVVRGLSRPLKAGLAPAASGARLRPILRDGRAPRCDSGAQTDVTALPTPPPPRWGSDGYLAYQKCGPMLALPPAPVCPPRPLPPRTPPRHGGARRELLSDIGFTSMVPELSRSADPLCALARRAAAPPGTEPDTRDTTTDTGTARYVSRGSSYRSPSLSMDRSTEWTPQTLPLPGITESVSWRASLPDVRSRSRSPETARLLAEADCFLRRSADSLRGDATLSVESVCPPLGQPYIPREPKQLRLGHAVKVITPCGRVAVGRVRYVGIAGATAANSSVVVGAEFPLGHGSGGNRNDGVYNGRRYFLAAHHYTALFVPFNKVVMAWAN